MKSTTRPRTINIPAPQSTMRRIKNAWETLLSVTLNMPTEYERHTREQIRLGTLLGRRFYENQLWQAMVVRNWPDHFAEDPFHFIEKVTETRGKDPTRYAPIRFWPDAVSKADPPPTLKGEP